MPEDWPVAAHAPCNGAVFRAGQIVEGYDVTPALQGMPLDTGAIRTLLFQAVGGPNAGFPALAAEAIGFECAGEWPRHQPEAEEVPVATLPRHAQFVFEFGGCGSCLSTCV